MSQQDSNDIRDTDNQQKDTGTAGLRQGGPDSLSGFVADDDAGDSSIGAAGSSSSGINSNFASASPESNVGPAGAPQNSHGNAGGEIPGGAQGKVESGKTN